jgi:ribosomal protein S18 acetylase RimI-like enzyme
MATGEKNAIVLGAKTMEGMRVRRGGSADARTIGQMVQKMIMDMENHGGYTATKTSAAWEETFSAIAKAADAEDARFFIAELPNHGYIGLSAGKLLTLSGPFAPKRILHISALYVASGFRRRGIATKLLCLLINWGRTAGAEQCELGVLSNSPARSLYEKRGFRPFEIKMTKSLQPYSPSSLQ